MVAKKKDEPQVKTGSAVIRVPVDVNPELMQRFFKAMGKDYPGWNRSEVIRKLIEDFCVKAGF
jgi:metal-responsive CopG/Arc/MetJ family transcriptional regulator